MVCLHLHDEAFFPNRAFEDAVKITGIHSFYSTLKGDFFDGELCKADKATVNVLRILPGGTNGAIVTRITEMIEAGKALQHPAIFPIHGAFLDDTRIGVVHMGTVHQDIIGYLKGQLEIFSPQSMLFLVIHIISGLAHLHDHNNFIGFMWGRSIMIGENGQPMIADLGFDFLICSSGSYGQITPACRWQAPELLTTTAAPTAASDVYSLGMTVLEMYTLRPPFDDVKRDTQFMVKMMEGSLTLRKPNNMPPGVWLVLKECWALDPGTRPTAREVLRRLELLQF